MRSSAVTGKRHGLSLLELLVALALLALIAGGLVGAFGVGTQVFDRARSLGAHQDELAARRQLRSAVVQALPPTRITPFPNSFQGAPDRLQFVTLKDAPYAPDAAAMRFDVVWSGDVLALTVQTLDDTGATRQEWVHTLSSGVQDVSFEFLDTVSDVPEWKPFWSDRADLPTLVRITGNGGTPRWVEFTVAPRL